MESATPNSSISSNNSSTIGAYLYTAKRTGVIGMAFSVTMHYLIRYNNQYAQTHQKAVHPFQLTAHVVLSPPTLRLFKMIDHNSTSLFLS
jgi:hypothetical protein